jgi:hypothetical protein
MRRNLTPYKDMKCRNALYKSETGTSFMRDVHVPKLYVSACSYCTPAYKGLSNTAPNPHTVTSGQNRQPDGRFDYSLNFSPMMAPAQTFEHSLTEEGSDYPVSARCIQTWLEQSAV